MFPKIVYIFKLIFYTFLEDILLKKKIKYIQKKQHEDIISKVLALSILVYYYYYIISNI